MKDIKMTTVEFDEYCRSGNYYVSDISYGLNKETKEWDVPMVEWESYMGRYWVRYKSEEARDNALDTNNLDMERFILNLREKESKRKLEKYYENQKVASLKTLGGMFPELELLKSKL